ncbi:hypothetical protein [Yoonia sp.]|uniref:hypothetical protein n=1 Tax=Yoonia sp. TaxID=2212373 RepID=UPI0023B673AE
MTELPDLYFRVRDNGAVVFRMGDDSRHRRLAFEQIAIVNTNRADFKAQGDHILTAGERAAIQDWIDARLAVLSGREVDDIHRTIDQINYASQWAQTKANDAQLAQVTDQLLLAMHDLRETLVRKKADRARPDP